MGFIDQEQRLKQTEFATGQVKQAEQARLAVTAARQLAIRMKTEEEDRKHGPEDNAKISELLGNLPRFDIPDYIELVKKHTGYSSSLRFYTRDEEFVKIDQGLNDRLSEFGFRNFKNGKEPGGFYSGSYFKTIHPKGMFCGQNIKPRNWFFNPPLAEPQEPGIGIVFEKDISTRRIGTKAKDKTVIFSTDWYTEILEATSHLVFVRLLAPDLVYITGSRQRRIPIESIEVLDNAIEEGFNHYFIKKERKELVHSIYETASGE